MGLGAGLGLGMILPQSMASSLTGNPATSNQNSSGSNNNSLESKLKNLKSLYDQELLTEEEYKSKRAKVLEDL